MHRICQCPDAGTTIPVLTDDRVSNTRQIGMLSSKLHDRRDPPSSSAMRFLGIGTVHPAIVAGSYIALLLIAVLTHGGAWNIGWQEDDAGQLLSVMNHPFWRLLFDRDVWVTFTFNAFTPVLAGEYWGDLLLFGLSPRGFHLHHTAELAITTIFTYRLLCRRIPWHLSMLATIGFLVAFPTFSIMTFLPSRHYLTGLLLSMVSVYMYQRALREKQSRNLLISAALFFLAMLAKELYAITLLYFLLTSWRTPLFRKVSTLYLLLFIIFAAWRAYMLDSLIGGYPNDYPFIEKLTSLAYVHRSIFGNDLVATVFAGCVGFLIFHHRLFRIRILVGLVAVLIAMYLPLLFATVVIAFPDDAALRLAFFPTWLCAAGLAYIAMLLHEAGAIKTACLLLLVFIAVTANASFLHMGDFRANLQERDTQAKFIMNAGLESALLPSSSIDVHDGPLLQQLALAAGHTPAGIIQFRNDVFSGFTSYWEYDTHCRCLVQLPYAKVLEKASSLESLNKPHESAPISLQVTWQAHQGSARIAVEPAVKSFCLLSVPGINSFKACPKSSVSLASLIPKERFALLHAVVIHNREDGLAIYTPYMSVPVDGTRQWSRGVFLPDSIRQGGRSGTCHIDAPDNNEVHLSRDAPLRLRGWILGPLNYPPDTIPLAILTGSTGKHYAANLHRELRPDVKNPGGVAIGGQVLDANLRQVEPGSYRLLLSVEDIICDTSITMTIR